MNKLLIGITLLTLTLNSFSQEVVVLDYFDDGSWTGSSLFETMNGDLITFDDGNFGFNLNLTGQSVVYYEGNGTKYGKGAIQFIDGSFAIPEFGQGILKVSPNRDAAWRTRIDSVEIIDVTFSNSGNIAFVGKYNQKLIVGEVNQLGDLVSTRELKDVFDFRSIRMTWISDSTYLIASANYNGEQMELSFIKLDNDLYGIWEKTFVDSGSSLFPDISNVVSLINGQILVGLRNFNSDFLLMKLASNGSVI